MEMESGAVQAQPFSSPNCEGPRCYL